MAGDPTDIPILYTDPWTDMATYIRRRWPGFEKNHHISMMEHYPPILDTELLLHYLRGIGGPFVDFIVLLDVGCGFELVPTNFESDDDAEEAKTLVETQFDKMDIEITMQRYAAWGEILGRHCNVRTYNAAGGFYFNEKAGITGIDCINPLTLDPNSVRDAVYDRTGEVDFIQNIVTPSAKVTTVNLSQDRVDYDVRGNILKHNPNGVSAFGNCLMDLRTAMAAPKLRLDLMFKQSNVYRHNIIDIDELMKTPMGEKVLEDWDLADKKLMEQGNMLREQEKTGKSMLTYSFLKPAEVSSMSGKATDFAETEHNTYDIIGMKMGIPTSLMSSTAAKTINRSSLTTIIESVVRRREATGSRKNYIRLLSGYAQEIKNQAGILEGYFKIKFKPFLSTDLLAELQRMNLLWQMGATSKTELRRNQDMSDNIDFGAEGESADYQDLLNSDYEIPNVNSHLTGGETTVQKNQRFIELKKALKECNCIM